MHVLLVNPCIRPDTPKLLPNVGLAYVASALKRAGFSFSILDLDLHRYSCSQIEQWLRDHDWDAVGIGTLTSQYGWTKGFAALCKSIRPFAPIFVGNTLGTSVPKVLLEKTQVDYCVIGEGEITVVELLAALEMGTPVHEVKGIAYKAHGQVFETGERETIRNVDLIPTPDWDVFEISTYLARSHHHILRSDKLPHPQEQMVSMPVTTARGCPFTCTFCYHAFQGTKYRHRSAASIATEMIALRDRYGVNFINFWDELSFSHPKQADQLATELLERQANLHFVASCRADLFREEHYPIAQKLRKAGCIALNYALENADDEILEHMNKKCDSRDFILQSHMLHEVGIDCTTSLVFGYPQETKETIRKTFVVLDKARIYPSVGYLEPMPGTPMYEEAKTLGVITDDENYLLKMGDRQDLRVNLTTMSNDDLQETVRAELVVLNKSLKTGLDESQLIKTGAYRTAKDSFLQGFGVAAEVAAQETC